jgi:D-beta-D-heptose 7-phosphate kinase/D-beta-D-heptose 1-phosphate adenosyltransferase
VRLSIPSFEGVQVLVVGDLMLDRYWYGPTSRISPEAPVPIVKVDTVEERPGGAGNVALNISALGGGATLLGLTGADQAADSLNELLTTRGVRCRLVRLPGNATIAKLRVISRHQQLLRLDFEYGFSGAGFDELLEGYRQALPAADVVILSDYGKGTLHKVNVLIDDARAAGKRVLVDPKGVDFARYRHASAVTPNQAEFEAVVGPCAGDEEVIDKGQRLLSELNLEALVITRSDKGMLLLRPAEAPLDYPTHARDVFDVTGAGDTVIGVLAAALAAGDDFPEAAALANLAAGVVVGKLGTATATVRELQDAMREHAPLQQGVVDERELVSLLARARASGERVVMTNGCFDILHAGHVAYLSKAAELGDRLLVAVNDDDSVQRLKGSSRPVNPLRQRMAVLAALKGVDWVVAFSEDTPRRLIDVLRPDVLVKGGDYRPEGIVGADLVRSRGGEVVVLDYIEGCSTSTILDGLHGRISREALGPEED